MSTDSVNGRAQVRPDLPPTLSRWFEELEPGAGFRSRGRTVTEADVVQFAALTGDLHPQHTDTVGGLEPLRRSHRAWDAGALVRGWTGHLDPERVVALRRIDQATFKAPVAIGDTIRVEGKVVELAELDEGHGLVGCAWRILNQDDRLTVRARIDVVWRRRPVQANTDPAAGGGASFVPVPL